MSEERERVLTKVDRFTRRLSLFSRHGGADGGFY